MSVAQPAPARRNIPLPTPPPSTMTATAARHAPTPRPGDVLAFALINYFGLHDRDAADVEELHGIDRETLVRVVGLRSAPSPMQVRFALAGVVERFGELRNWPSPFSFDGEYLRLHAPASGLIFPTWRAGSFRGWLHYRNARDAAPRWVSSRFAPGGSKAEASIHVRNPKPARSSRVCMLVAHPFKAEALGGPGVLSVASANGLPPPVVARQLREEWPELRAVAVDLPEPGDFAAVLERAGLRVEVAL